MNKPTQASTLAALFTALFFVGAIISYVMFDVQTAILLALLALVVKPNEVKVMNFPAPPQADPRRDLEARPMGK